MLKIVIICIVIGVADFSHTGYYEVLGVSKQASTQEIRQAYKKMAIKYHPDKNSDIEDQKKFIQITEAYETLKDPEKRRKYDLYGSFPTYTRKYDSRSQAEYDNLFYNGLYHEDAHVETLSPHSYNNFLDDGFHFINFYSPFCPPCQNLVDHWKKLAELYKGIVKIGAMNCKYHNSFCYNSMRITSYPTLLFYPAGKSGNFVYYRGERTLEALNEFLASQLSSRVVVPVVTRLRGGDAPTAAVLGSNRIERAAITRIAYLLKGLVTLVIVEDEELRAKLTKDEYAAVVFRHRGSSLDIRSTEEKQLLRDIIDALPKTDLVGPEKLREIRNQLRSGSQKPWALYFTSKGHDRLIFNQMRLAFPDMHFGEMDCDKWGELCASLHAPSASLPAWGVLKVGGAYERARGDARAFLRNAPRATRTHSLSAADRARVLDARDPGTWVLLVVPHRAPWGHAAETFTRVSLQFLHEDMDFGMLSCSPSDSWCSEVAAGAAAVALRRAGRTHVYGGQLDERPLAEFIQLILDTEDVDVEEQQVLEVQGPRRRSWLVAFLPPRCRQCHALAHQWRLVANKLRPLDFVRVRLLQCERAAGLCANVRAPTARLYPAGSRAHHSVSLEHVSQAAYMWEWALGLLLESQPLTWQTFSRHVVSEDLDFDSHKKPWLVYFHSPRCYRCYEMYADFAIAGSFLGGSVQLGKVNCVSERHLCQHEHISSYPSLRLYLPRSAHHHFSSVLSIKLADYATLLTEIKPHIVERKRLDSAHQGFHMKHDEF